VVALKVLPRGPREPQYRPFEGRH